MKPTDIEGWMEPYHLDILQKLVRALTVDGPVVELGSYKGRSSSAIGVACRTAKRQCICVDPFEDYWTKKGATTPVPKIKEAFLDNMQQIGLVINQDFSLLCMTSIEALKEIQAAAMVFIDTTHTYKNTCAELNGWIPKIVPGGILACHDYCSSYPGVVKAWNEIVNTHVRATHIKASGSLIRTVLQ